MKKGISLIVLTIVVIVLLTLAGTITFSVINTQKNVKTLEFANEIANVQERVNLYYEKYNKYPIENELNTTSINVEKSAEQFQDENIENNTVTLNYVDLSEIFEDNSSYTDELRTLRYGHNSSENDLYLISTKTGKVYYKASVYDNYTLTDELKNKINYVEELDGAVKVSNIIFEKSEKNYTNKPIYTTIKVPQEYIQVSCTVLPQDGATILGGTTENGYNVYTVSNDTAGNYTVVVSWKEKQDSEENITSFVVDNFDNTSPQIEIIDDKKEIINNITDEKSNFYYLEYSDDKSGVSEVKYAEHKIISDEENNYNSNLEVVRKYMEQKGKKVDLNSISLSNGTSFVTLYIKDNAGNDKYIIKEVAEL